MAILVSQKILDYIRDELTQSTESFLLISAFCKLPLIQHFDSCIENKNIEKKLVVRFRVEDILSGVSDLELYPYCRDNGWRIFFRLDLHAKTYIFDRLRCVVGSANATGNGMNLDGRGNLEMATTCELDEDDAKQLDLLLLGSVEMTDEIYNAMTHVIQDIQCEKSLTRDWPAEINELFKPDYSLLFTEDFPSCDDPRDAETEELLFLNLPTSASLNQITAAFCNSKCYLWLCDLVGRQENREMYYGAISAALHNSLLNEPKPYRKDVKQILSHLLHWIEVLQVKEIVIDRPNHSQRVRYVKN